MSMRNGVHPGLTLIRPFAGGQRSISVLRMLKCPFMNADFNRFVVQSNAKLSDGGLWGLIGLGILFENVDIGAKKSCAHSNTRHRLRFASRKLSLSYV